MKTFLKWSLSVIAILLIICGLIYFFVVRPISREEADLKPVLPVDAAKFIACVETSEAESCYENFTSETFRNSMDLQKFRIFSNLIRSKLGPRISGALDENNFNLNVFKGTGGTVKTVKFVMKAIYQEDATVTETFIYEFDRKSQTYRIQSFNINSSKILN